MISRLALAAGCAVIALAGCTNLPRAQDYSTSLGEDQMQLQADPAWSAGRLWTRPGPPIGSVYEKKLVMDPVAYIPGDRPDDLDFKDNAALRERVLAYMNEAVRREFSQAGYQLLSAPAPHALRIRAAITGTFKNDRDPRAMEYIPIGYVIGQTAKAAGYRDQSARLLIEAAVRDANTNELLIASLGTVTGSNLPPDQKPTPDDVRAAIDDWVRQVRLQFDRNWQTAKP
ncbi:DUF3313 domain-containing protein [Achromobacter sp. Bel]|uniref:DUF3313 domain-containing protein n=1 Tax=Achromobacter sp. Bel TaxID=2727415 RepID=UPI00145C6ADF|nr:DUF3313 domain-containing protein [Achromobacter sp. Bel]NMK48071.1 DUF3313 domain-containing protein [Achromobacter sp. Bel]